MKFPFTIIKSSKLDSLRNRTYKNRPDNGLYSTMGSADTGLVPMIPVSFRECQEIVKASDTLSTIMNALKQEIFRNGGEFIERFVSKCTNPNCGKEFDNKTDICDKCSSETREADASQLTDIRPLFTNRQVNFNGQLIDEVMQQIEDDLNTVDIGFLFINKQYMFVNHELTNSIPREILRIDPTMIRLIADKQGNLGVDDDGKPVYTCLIHKNQLLHEDGYCPECGNKLFKAQYVCVDQQGEGNKYYTRDEVFHTTKYTKSLTYGWPQVILCWRKVLTLIYQDDLILDWYKGKKPPRGILLVASRAWDQLTKAWDWLMNKVRTDKNGVYPLAVDVPSGKTGQFAQFISFMNNLEEMQYTETREEIRRTIGALYGVMPIFQGDNSTSGGLNNEGLQVTVTVRAALNGQNIYNKKLFPWLLKQLNITDWDYMLNSPEEKDEMAELQREQLKIQNAKQMLDMGFDVTYNEDGDFDFGGTAKPMMQQQFGLPPLPQIDSDMHDGQPDAFNKSDGFVIKKIIEDEFNYVEKSMNQNIIMKADDMTEFIKKAIYDLAFQGLSVKKSDLIKNYLLSKAGDRISLDTIVKEIKDIAGLTKPEAERIGRTEFLSVIQNKAREFAYRQADPDDENKYVWMGPDDHRTTKICKNITKRVSNGVSLDKLKSIIKSEADKATYDANRPWTPHINCRHRLVLKPRR